MDKFYADTFLQLVEQHICSLGVLDRESTVERRNGHHFSPYFSDLTIKFYSICKNDLIFP